MVDKTNEAYLNFTSTPADRKTLEALFQMILVIVVVVVVCLCKMPLALKTQELVCSAVSEGRVCNSCATCISHTVSLGWEVPCEIVCEMHIAQLLQTLSLLTAEHTNSSVMG
jgi:hypothetical protein